MKKTFEKPEIEVIEIDSDIICLSGGPGVVLPDDPFEMYAIDNSMELYGLELDDYVAAREAGIPIDD